MHFCFTNKYFYKVIRDEQELVALQIAPGLQRIRGLAGTGKEEYKKHRLDEEGKYKSNQHIINVNSACVPIKEHDIFRYISHIRIPIPIHSEGHGQ